MTNFHTTPSGLTLVVASGGLACLAAIFAAGDGAQAAVSSNAIALAPHRAVYEIVLDRSRSGSGVRALKGRMVYELTGSVCEGYTQNMRFVTRTIGSKGRTTIADMRSSTWEEGLGKKFRFNSSQYQDEKLLERVRGDASRRGGNSSKTKVNLSQPKERKLQLNSPLYFPVQHSIALLRAAHAGKTVFQADLYDGTDSGDKIYATTTIIGPKLPQSADRKLPAVKHTENLRSMKVWPVSISYFIKKPGETEHKDTTPIYELAFRFYANGVSRRLFIDYGSFSVRGRLTSLTYYPVSSCRAAKTAAGRKDSISDIGDNNQ